MTSPIVQSQDLLSFELYEQNTINFELSQIQPEECENLSVVYTLIDVGTGTEIDPSIYTIDEILVPPGSPSIVSITVDDRSYVDQYTPEIPLELVIRAEVGPSVNPYDEQISEPFTVTFVDPC